MCWYNDKAESLSCWAVEDGVPRGLILCRFLLFTHLTLLKQLTLKAKKNQIVLLQWFSLGVEKLIYHI